MSVLLSVRLHLDCDGPCHQPTQTEPITYHVSMLGGGDVCLSVYLSLSLSKSIQYWLWWAMSPVTQTRPTTHHVSMFGGGDVCLSVCLSTCLSLSLSLCNIDCDEPCHQSPRQGRLLTMCPCLAVEMSVCLSTCLSLSKSIQYWLWWAMSPVTQTRPTTHHVSMFGGADVCLSVYLSLSLSLYNIDCDEPCHQSPRQGRPLTMCPCLAVQMSVCLSTCLSLSKSIQYWLWWAMSPVTQTRPTTHHVSMFGGGDVCRRVLVLRTAGRFPLLAL